MATAIVAQDRPIFIVGIIVFFILKRRSKIAVVQQQVSVTVQKRKKKKFETQELEKFKVVPFNMDMVKEIGATPDNIGHVSIEISRTATVSSGDGDSGTYYCPVCFDPIEEGGDIRLIPCHHLMHKDCLDTWLVERSVLCPLCRYDLDAMMSFHDSESSQPETETVNVTINRIVQG
ncbi:E3 ubiquitin-protein ligase [Smittium mucronatum]|uniref:E3 ubiquitin-protein ligase n=1 Tax=Smittium mucronatum TaxID=133383 RepID=A0A1R0H3J9_9FUNG|nr:E3 ubiquitin-protein ligase [Smittium mucronatum]